MKDEYNHLISNEVMYEITNEYLALSMRHSMSILQCLKCKTYRDSIHMLSNIELTQETIASKLSKSNVNKAPGVDRIVVTISTLMYFDVRIKYLLLLSTPVSRSVYYAGSSK